MAEQAIKSQQRREAKGTVIPPDVALDSTMGALSQHFRAILEGKKRTPLGGDVPADAGNSPSVQQELSIELFSQEFSYSEEDLDAENLMGHIGSESRRLSEAVKDHGLEHSGLETFLEDDFRLRLPIDELVNNTLTYGIYGLSAAEREDLCSRDGTVKSKTITSLQDKLDARSPEEKAGRTGSMSLELIKHGDDLALVLRTVDSGKFPAFKKKWGKIKAGATQDANARHFGRGLVIVHSLFKEADQDPKTGEITFYASLS